MKPIPRTVSEVGVDESAPCSLADYRDDPALVLVGDAGSGKTTEFRGECEALAERGEFVTAREFINLGCDTDLTEKTLFIDGLDEVRAGEGDLRKPLDAIVKQLHDLGRPRFRLSCRALDLGRTDEETLQRVSPNGSVRLVRLDPLRDSDIEAFVESHDRMAQATEFLETARRKGLSGMLRNPQSLDLLLHAFTKSGGRLPKSRREVFEQACLALSAEQNDQHLDSSRAWPAEQEIVDAASEVCALVLLSGAAGVRRHEKDRTADWVFLGNLPDHPRDAVEAAVGTTLFTAASQVHRIEPVHRVVGEFLAARRLAARVAEGVSVRRVLSLITVESNARVVPTPLRGLAAWLAALCPLARRHFIDCDPVGVAAYGDTTDFSTEDKERLLQALGEREPEFGSWRFSEDLVEILSVPEMEPALLQALKSADGRDSVEVVAGLALRALAIGEPRRGLHEDLMSIVRDPIHFPIVRLQALDAVLHNDGRDSGATASLRELLEDIREERVADDDRQLSGTLLRELYPTKIAPEDIWRFLMDQPHRLYGRDEVFWGRLAHETPARQLPTVLDRLETQPEEFWRTVRAREFDDFPARIVARAVEELGDETSVADLYRWLRSGLRRRSLASYAGQMAVHAIYEWLRVRPSLLKQLWKEGIERYIEAEDHEQEGRDVRLVLGGVEPPPDFGRFCLAEAVVAAPESPTLAYWLLQQAFERSPAEGVPLHEVKERACRSATLAKWVRDFIPDPKSEEPARPTWQERRAREVRRHQAKRRDQDAKWEESVRSNLEALRANRAEPWLLERLAWEYLGTLEEYAIGGPRTGWRIQAPELRSAAMEGLRGTPSRDDVPDERELFRLHREGRRHLFGPPFLAGLEAMERGDPERVDSMDETRQRRALAFYYLEATGGLETPKWYRHLVVVNPELTAAVMVRWAKATFRRDRPTVVHLDSLLRNADYAEVARRAVLPLLTAFPVRKKADWHSVLDLLLWVAVARADRKEFLDLVERKLGAKSMTVAQRAHWVAAGLAAEPSQYHDRFEEMTGDEEILREAAGFLCSNLPTPFPRERCKVPTLRLLVTRLGGMFPPNDPEADEDDERAMGHIWGLPDYAASFTERCLRELSSRPAPEAGEALRGLGDDASLVRWKRKIHEAHQQQRIVRRDAEYQVPTVADIVKTLRDTAPTSAGGLLDLILDHLYDLNEEIRWNYSDIWRYFWNEDRYGKPAGAKPENSCRDALADLLRHRLDDGIRIHSEKRHAGGFRSDLRLTVPGSPNSVSIEIKIDKSDDLWKAVGEQLIRKYLAPGDRGIYLVLWLGGEGMLSPPTGSRPTTPEVLQERLCESLTTEQRDRVAVRVLDVRSPTQRFAAEDESERPGSEGQR